MRNGISRVLCTALACASFVPGALAAHAGHEHTLMGVVQKIGEASLDISLRDETTKQDRTVTVVLNDKTLLRRGDRPVVLRDLKVGERIVVKAVMTKDEAGRDVYTAKQLRVGAIGS